MVFDVLRSVVGDGVVRGDGSCMFPFFGRSRYFVAELVVTRGANRVIVGHVDVMGKFTVDLRFVGLVG